MALRNLIDDLSWLAYPKATPDNVNPPELADDAESDFADRRERLAQQIQAAWEGGDIDPLIGQLSEARARRDAADREIRLLMAYGREFTGTRPDYTWESLAAAAGLPYSTARNAFDEDDIATVSEILGTEPRRRTPRKQS
ncbi:hypothetical protein DFQ14_103112 [Halopolyspora algeriensis]|uniref:Uncharacterized protein n=1 Tax=Halopolyspora algeriensis TaxID=1500506 RepID=A0A368VWN5_9ACTN|nr:hypothetical protein [Halopolyspora algeriensis]RCW45148.1 hypothetical protein DFQ14_103112 [Halopolyspora algeriensis]TQM53132.1 hypothetical protein FHU43_2512 [Halopolyspora algeriensis]